jgi:Uma2 family endonuclease
MSVAVGTVDGEVKGGEPAGGDRVALVLNGRVHPRVTLEEFAELCGLNPDLRLERTAGGELIAMAPAGSESGGRNASLVAQLYMWSARDGTGKAFDSSAGFTLPNGAIRSPDASWLRKERWDALTAEEKRGFAPICPDFVAELRSPSDRIDLVREKLVEYLANGARLGWLIDPLEGVVEVYRPGGSVERLVKPAEVSGEAVLPGFMLNLQGILGD